MVTRFLTLCIFFPPAFFQFCSSRGLDAPEFKPCAMPGQKVWLSTVIVDNGCRFQTYPKDYPTEEMAEDAVAKMALEVLTKKVRETGPALI